MHTIRESDRENRPPDCMSSYGLDGSQYCGKMTQYVVTGEILSTTTVEISTSYAVLGNMAGGTVLFSRKLGPISTNQIPNIQTIPLSGKSFWGSIGLHGMGTVKKALN